MTKVLKIKYYKVSTFLDLSQHISFDFLPSLFYFLFGFCRNARLDFGFFSDFTASYPQQAT